MKTTRMSTGMVLTLLVGFLLTPTGSLLAEEPSTGNINEALKDYLQAAQEDRVEERALEVILRHPWTETAPLLKPLFSSGQTKTRAAAYAIMGSLFWKSNPATAQPEILTEYLAALAGEKSEDIRSDEYRLFLRKVPREAFTDSAKKEMLGIFGKGERDFHFLLACGNANLETIQKDLVAIGQSTPNLDKERDCPEWAAWLALARMGQRDAAIQCAQWVARTEDRIFRVSVLFEDLAYTRHPDALAPLIVELTSDERFPSVKGNNPGEKYALRAARQLSEVIPDFPKQRTDETVEAFLARAREWTRNPTSP